MTDRKIADEQSKDMGPSALNRKGAWLRGIARGSHLQQIDEQVDAG